MAIEPDVQSLVQQILESGRSVDEVCRDCMHLRPQVRHVLSRVRAVAEEIDAMFATAGAATAATTAQLPLIPGYDVKAMLGRGGMGVVYHAHHQKLDRPVAIKMLLSGVYASPADTERFRREAVAVARLHHANIVQVHDVGDFEGRPFFTMELLEGGSLAAKLAGTPRPAQEAATLLATLAEAVHAAHSSGIVHRDLKPANVLLATDGTPKIADFGLARTIGSEPGLTLTGARLGTPSYMAPEQALGRKDAIGPAVDVYALGAVLYEVLTGRPPFRGETAAETERQVIAVTPAPPSRLNASVPRDLETICLKCLNKDPARRYATAADLAADLGRFLRHEPIVARRIGRVSRALRWAQRRPAAAALLVLVLLLLMLGTGLVVQQEVVAGERRANSERVRPRLDAVAQQLREDRDILQAKVMLDQISGPLARDLEDRLRELRREIGLIASLDAIRLERIAVRDGRFDPRANCRWIAEHYDRLFREAGFEVAVDDPVAAGTRIRRMHARMQVVAALDDWALISRNPRIVGWIWLAARHADVDPTGWRERFRDTSVLANPQQLQQLADDAPLDRQSVQVLTALVEEMQSTKMDCGPFLRRVQHAFPGDFWINFHLGVSLWKTEPLEAVRFLQAALAVKPEAPAVHVLLGRALAACNRTSEARDCFLAAVRLEPTYAQAHIDLGWARHSLGEHDKAQESFAEGIRCDPADPTAHHHFGTVLFERGNAPAAIESLRQAVHLAPEKAEYHQGLGKALEAAKRHDEAKVAFEAMHRLAGSGNRALLVQNRLAEALAATTKAAGLEPRSAASVCELGDCLVKLGRREDAVAEFRAALVLEPRNEHVRKRVLGLLTVLGRHDEAVALYEQAIAERPEQPEAWDGYAELCLYIGRTDDYRRVCARVVERFGAATDPRECELTARVCLLLPPDQPVLERAIAMIERAVAAEDATRAPGPMHAFHLTQLLACYRAGRFDDVLSTQSQRPFGDLAPAPMFVLAMASHRAGKTELGWRMLGVACLLFDWRSLYTTGRLGWLMHVLRREAEALIAPHLPDMLARRREPQEDEDRAILLAACCARDQNAMAARLYAQLLTAKSKVGQFSRQTPYRAACVALAAGMGIGGDAAALDEAGRAQCRSWARQWLVVQLDRKETDYGSLPLEPRQQLIDELRFWTYDPELAPLREPAALERLPEAERQQCRQLLERLAALLAKADAGEAVAPQPAGLPAATPLPTENR